MNLPTTSSSVDYEDLSLVIQEIRELGFDAIRFASYRTAAKLRYVQKKSNVDLLDIWNIIEAFRDNGLNALDRFSIITVPKLESILVSLYINLNKRLPHGHQVDLSSSVRYLLSWLLIAYDNEGSGRIRVFSVKVGLVTLCSGKLVDKLRYIFSQISDESSGTLIFSRFEEYLKELLALPAMVLESPTFGYTEDVGRTIFDGTSNVFMNDFLQTLLSEPGPLCLIWMPLLSAVAAVESVSHPVPCNVCRSKTIQGFRYKCQKCSNFNMCQNCFWQGKTTENHRTEHEVKEYSSSKPAGSFRNSFRRSFRCVPKSKKMPRYPDQPERPINLAHIVTFEAGKTAGVGANFASLNLHSPPSPLPTHNGFTISTPASFSQLDAYAEQRVPSDLGYGPSNLNNKSSSSYSESLSESDEEHRLIARYTARLASEAKYSKRTSSQTSMSLFDSTQTQKDMIAQLEARNRDIMREIARLRYQQELEYLNDETAEPVVLDELEALRYHKSDLEEKLAGLQDSRAHLMSQMEGLMKLLRAQQSNASIHTIRAPGSGYIVGTYGSLHRSAPTTPQHQQNAFSGELRSAFSTGEEDFNSISSDASSSVRYMKNDLLLAADSVTNAMSSLVRELNSEDEEEFQALRPRPQSVELYRTSMWDKEIETKRLEEEEKYLEELRNLRLSNGTLSDGGHESQVEELLYKAKDLNFSSDGDIDSSSRFPNSGGENKALKEEIQDESFRSKVDDGNEIDWNERSRRAY